MWLPKASHSRSLAATKREDRLAQRFAHHRVPFKLLDPIEIAPPGSALAEFFQTRRTSNVRHRQPWLVGFAFAPEVRPLDLTGLWSTQAGGSMAIAGGPWPRARVWACAIYLAYPQAEGVWYGSSMHANTPCVALFERAQDALPPLPGYHRALADETLAAFLSNVAADLNFRLIL